jgi:hypothetical protein
VPYLLRMQIEGGEQDGGEADDQRDSHSWSVAGVGGGRGRAGRFHQFIVQVLQEDGLVVLGLGHWTGHTEQLFASGGRELSDAILYIVQWHESH